MNISEHSCFIKRIILFVLIIDYDRTQRFSRMLVSPDREDEIEAFCGELAAEFEENGGVPEHYPSCLPQEWQTAFTCIGEANHKVF